MDHQVTPTVTSPAYDYVFNGTDALQALSTQQRQVAGIMERLSDSQAEQTYEEGKWSLKELLGHMIDTERIMGYRALAIARGEQQPLPGFDENAYVVAAGFNKNSLAQLLVQYHAQRTATVYMFASFSEEMMNRKGIANGKERSVRDIMTLIAAHEQHHLSIMNERYLTMWH